MLQAKLPGIPKKKFRMTRCLQSPLAGGNEKMNANHTDVIKAKGEANYQIKVLNLHRIPIELQYSIAPKASTIFNLQLQCSIAPKASTIFNLQLQYSIAPKASTIFQVPNQVLNPTLNQAKILGQFPLLAAPCGGV